MRAAVAVALAGLLVIAGCSGTSGSSGSPAGRGEGRTPPTPATDPGTVTAPAPVPVPDGTQSLRGAGSSHEVAMGTAVAVEPLATEPQYAATLTREYGMVTPENALKWAVVEPRPGATDYAGADRIVDLAEQHDMQIRGHSLVWYRQVPAWITGRRWTRAQLEAVLHRHIQEEVGRYRGRIAQWDVVNEALDDRGRLRDDVFLRTIGPRYVELAFRWAHEADPLAQLYYNDYGLESSGPKGAAAVTLVQRLRRRGVPIGGVGIEAHQSATRPSSAAGLRAALQRFAGLGVDVAVTELDVRVPEPADAAALGAQAARYREVLDACLAVERCHTFVTWGFTDAHSWVPGRYPGQGSALPFDARYRPKPAYDALLAALDAARRPED